MAAADTATAVETAESRFDAMGTHAHVVAAGDRPRELVARARELIERLEARWSRFRPDSELSQLNAGAGYPVLVSDETFSVIELAVSAWGETEGRFDPTVLAAMEANGYDRPFEQLTLRSEEPSANRAGPAPGCDGILLDPVTRTVILPPGAGLDLGGIGKGRSADLVAEEIVAAGAAGVCVNLGGDLRVIGQAPHSDGWVVALEDPFEPAVTTTCVALAQGALASSTCTKRRWTAAGRPHHHLVEPSTGRPARSGLAAVSVVAADAVAAEVLAKAALIGGPEDGVEFLVRRGVAALVTADDGRVIRIGSWSEYER